MNDPKDKVEKRDEAYPGYPSQPEGEDIYRHAKEVSLNKNASDIDVSSDEDSSMPPEDTLDDQFVTDVNADDGWNEENFDEVHTGADLDVPGSELDDDQEDVGNEDEENNYYSLPD